MTDQEYTIACLQAENKKLKKSLADAIRLFKSYRQKPDKGHTTMKSIWDMEKEGNNLINPVRTASQAMFEGL